MSKFYKQYFSILFCVAIAIVAFIAREVFAVCLAAKVEQPTRLLACKEADISRVYGRIQFVDTFPDYKVKIVNAFPDLKVQKVVAFPSAPGKWKIVTSTPDYKIKIVDAFPDFTIKYVTAFPGVN